MAIRQMAGKIVGAEYRDHAVRAMAQHCRVVGLRRAALSGTFMKGADRDIDLADHGGYFGGSFPKRFAGLKSDSVSEQGLMFAQKACKFLEVRGPRLDAQAGPRRKGCTGYADGISYGRCRCSTTFPCGGLRDRIF